jgi:hypothetical protein
VSERSSQWVSTLSPDTVLIRKEERKKTIYESSIGETSGLAKFFVVLLLKTVSMSMRAHNFLRQNAFSIPTCVYWTMVSWNDAKTCKRSMIQCLANRSSSRDNELNLTMLSESTRVISLFGLWKIWNRRVASPLRYLKLKLLVIRKALFLYHTKSTLSTLALIKKKSSTRYSCIQTYKLIHTSNYIMCDTNWCTFCDKQISAFSVRTC